MIKRFNTIDGETLMTMPLKPINFIVENLLSEGLHILAGSPKVGKSWLALWLSVAVSKGEDVWGNKVKQGDTLYLCFEDSQIRIQNRLFDITDEATKAVNFCTENVLLGGELEDRIVTFITEHPDTVLIIIDTLQMIRNTSKDNNYASDYSDLTILKKLADKYGIAILLIHHLRKENDKDPFNRISGTTGIQGAVDSSFILVEETRGSGVATLSCVGRDIDYREIKLKRDEDNVWQVVSDSFENHDLLLDDIVILLSDFMKDKEYHKSTPTELADELSKDRVDKISPKTLTKKILQNTVELEKRCISAVIRKSNGKRRIEIFRNRVDRVDKMSTP
ncbi:AAA family ATPase [Soehngenia saccharolytica]|nr:AAA family ATPase [Soehngenia saccharolytica]